MNHNNKQQQLFLYSTWNFNNVSPLSTGCVCFFFLFVSFERRSRMNSCDQSKQFERMPSVSDINIVDWWIFVGKDSTICNRNVGVGKNLRR